MFGQEKPMNEQNRKTPPPTERGGKRKSLAIFSAALFVGISLFASQSSLPPAPATAVADDDKPGAATDRAVKAANVFLDALDAKQRNQARYEFTSTRKSRWSNLPVTFVPRNGVRLGDLTKNQRTRAMDLLAAVLSKSGYQKIVDIMDGDQKLTEGGQGRRGARGGRPMFGADQYFLAIFGKPSATEAWMVQFGGHHLGLNVTVIGKHFVLTPTHTGAQPAQFKRNGKAVRPLGLENDTGFKLVNALDKKQRAQAVIGERPQRDLLLGPGRDDRKMPQPQGIKGSALTRDQQAMLMDLIGAWVQIVEPGVATGRMAEIKRKIGETYFAWMGSTTKGSAVYFRVQGPAVWIEYAPQGSTDHIHTVVRNPKDDYGAGLLKQ
jgi:hypothetical protein